MSRPTHKRKSPGRNSLPWQQKKNRNKWVYKNKRKSKGRQKENKRNRIRQDPSTPASFSSPTDFERLNANVSSRDGLRKPLLTSSGHKCPPSESSRDKGNPASIQETQSLGPADPPTQTQATRSPSPPPISVHVPCPPEGVRPQQNHRKLHHQLVSKDSLGYTNILVRRNILTKSLSLWFSDLIQLSSPIFLGIRRCGHCISLLETYQPASRTPLTLYR